MNINHKGLNINWDTQALGQRIRGIRGKLSQREFAGKIGVTQVEVSRYERGMRTPPVDILLKLSALGNVSVDYLLRGTGKDSSSVADPAGTYERSTEILWMGNLAKPDQTLLRRLAKRLSESSAS